MIIRTSLLALIFSLVACGGGGGGSGSISKKVEAVISTGAGGSVSPMAASLPVGSSASFALTPAEGYSVKSAVGCNGSLQGATFTTGALTANCNISIEFVRNSYDIGVTAGAGGSAEVSKTTVLHGDSWTLVLQPEPGYQIGDVSGCGAGSIGDNSYTTAPIKANCQLDVQFTKRLVQITGVVAVGAPLTNARVDARCRDNSGFASEVITDEQGIFTGQVAELDLPCALRATSTNPALSLHGFAVQGGRANITSFTDMVLALASGQQPTDWYAGNQFELVEPLLANNWERLLDIFKSTGYSLPSGAFDPFAGSLAIGDDWDKLLDQLGIGLAQTQGASYRQLLTDLLAQENYKFPLPNGDQEETAEACFNPELYKAGTVVTAKTHSITLYDGGEASHNTKDQQWINLDLAETENGMLLTQEFSFTSVIYSSRDIDNRGQIGGIGYRRKLIDSKGKSVADVSTDYLIDPSLSSPDHPMTDFAYVENYESQGDQIRFRFPRETDFYEFYNFTSEFSFSLVFNPAEKIRQRLDSVHSKTRRFVGIKNLVRDGITYEVCEFSVAEQKTVSAESTHPTIFPGEYNENYSQYFLVGAGVEVTDTTITSIAINGVEVYHNSVE